MTSDSRIFVEDILKTHSFRNIWPHESIFFHGHAWVLQPGEYRCLPFDSLSSEFVSTVGNSLSAYIFEENGLETPTKSDFNCFSKLIA